MKLLIEGDRAGLAIYRDEPGAGFGRIDIGAQMMTRHAIKPFDSEHKFGGHLLGLIEPAPHRGLGSAEIASELRLASCCLNGCEEGFETGGPNIHNQMIIHMWMDGQPISYGANLFMLG